MALFGSGGEVEIPGYARVAQANALGANQLQNALIRFLASGQPATVVPFGKGAYRGGGTPFPTGTSLEALGYEGDVVPGAGPLLESAFSRAGQIGTGAPTEARLSQLGTLVQGQPAVNLDPALRERFFQSSVVDPAMRRFERDTIPAILARFGGGGQTGAIREELARAGTDLQTNLAGIGAGLLRDDERLNAQLADQAQQRSLAAIGSLREEELLPISVQTQIGDLQRSIVGQQNQEALYRALLASPYGDPRLSMLPLIGGASSTFGPQVSAGGNPLSGLLNLMGGF